MSAHEIRERLARSEASAACLLAESMRVNGNAAAATVELDAGTIVSLGHGRYVNRMLSHELVLTSADLDTAEAVFTSLDLAPSWQTSSTITADSVGLLRDRGFTIAWKRVVMAASASESPGFQLGPHVRVSTVDDALLDVWLDVLARGNEALSAEARARSDEYGRAAHDVAATIDLLAWVDDEPVACGSLQRVDSIAWLGGAATIPEHRGRGLQRGLLDVRLELAALDRNDYVAATAVPDSTSMRNLARAGLALVDTQVVWTTG